MSYLRVMLRIGTVAVVVIIDKSGFSAGVVEVVSSNKSAADSALARARARVEGRSSPWARPVAKTYGAPKRERTEREMDMSNA
jgi:hypothetical protein